MKKANTTKREQHLQKMQNRERVLVRREHPLGEQALALAMPWVGEGFEVVSVWEYEAARGHALEWQESLKYLNGRRKAAHGRGNGA
jgi:hypothetical protein